jgi:hypothetical protein
MLAASFSLVEETRGKRRRITKAWRRRVNQWGADRGHGAWRELAKAAGCKESTITKLRDGSSKTSPYVDAISDHIGLVFYGEEYISPELLRLYKKLQSLPDDALDNIEPLVDAFAAKNQNKAH